MNIKTRHALDLRLVSTRQGWIALTVTTIALLLLPQVLPAYSYLAALWMIYALVAVGLNILVGMTGQISLGHAGFFAVGAYVVASLTALSVPFLLTLIAAIVVCALLGYLVGIPALKLEGPYLAIATSGFGLAVQQLLGGTPFFGGHSGLIVEKPVIFGIAFTRDRDYYYVVLIVAALFVFMAFNLARSHIGRSFLAVRDAELAAQTGGVNLKATKTLAFAISAAYAGVAGGLFAPLLGIVTPDGFGLLKSIEFLSMIVVGGIGTVAGGVLGAGLVVLLQDQLAQAGNLAALLYGAVVMFVLILEPLGLYGRWMKIKLYWKGWPL